jgi:hypothetical protein
MQLRGALGVFLGKFAILVQESELFQKLLSLLRRRGIFDTLGLHGFNELLKFLFAQGVLLEGEPPTPGGQLSRLMTEYISAPPLRPTPARGRGRAR